MGSPRVAVAVGAGRSQFQCCMPESMSGLKAPARAAWRCWWRHSRVLELAWMSDDAIGTDGICITSSRCRLWSSMSGCAMLVLRIVVSLRAERVPSWGKEGRETRCGCVLRTACALAAK